MCTRSTNISSTMSCSQQDNSFSRDCHSLCAYCTFFICNQINIPFLTTSTVSHSCKSMHNTQEEVQLNFVCHSSNDLRQEIQLSTFINSREWRSIPVKFYLYNYSTSLMAVVPLQSTQHLALLGLFRQLTLVWLYTICSYQCSS